MVHHLGILEFKLDSDRRGGVLEFSPEKGVGYVVCTNGSMKVRFSDQKSS